MDVTQLSLFIIYLFIYFCIFHSVRYDSVAAMRSTDMFKVLHTPTVNTLRPTGYSIYCAHMQLDIHTLTELSIILRPWNDRKVGGLFFVTVRCLMVCQ
jgi:hypothetical protein